MKSDKGFYVYILECNDQTLYTGWTIDVNKRVIRHNEGKGARYTRSRLPVVLRYVEAVSTKQEALQREYFLKRLPREKRIQLITEGNSFLNLNDKSKLMKVNQCRMIRAVVAELQHYADQAKAEFLPKFFQAYPGGYAEGDQFVGVSVPNQRKIARKYYQQITMGEVKNLLHESVHEYRLTALFMLVLKYQHKQSASEKKDIVDLYLDNTNYINNWDLVDSSAEKILGPYLVDREKDVLDELAQSNNLWKQRIAIIATYHFIKNYQYDDTLRIASILLRHKHDLIHKAVGWMLREVGNRDFEVEYNFLVRNYKEMPRTMLRYAIEKFDEELRQRFLNGLINM